MISHLWFSLSSLSFSSTSVTVCKSHLILLFKLLFPKDLSAVWNIGLTGVFPGTCNLLHFPLVNVLTARVPCARGLSVSHLPPVMGVLLMASGERVSLRPFLITIVLDGVSQGTDSEMEIHVCRNYTGEVLRIYTYREQNKLALCKMLKDSACSVGDLGGTGSIPGPERSLEGRNGYPL